MDSSAQSNLLDDQKMLLNLRGVEKFYGKNRVLSIDKLDVKIGERIMVTGTNASGKSTLLRLLAGVTSKTSGDLIRSPKMKQLRVCFVPQVGGLNPEHTVLENLRAIERLYGRSMKTSPSEWPIVSLFGLDGYLNATVRDLSGGYQKLVSLAAAFGIEPEVVFLDEPLTGLDEKHANLLDEALSSLLKTVSLMVITSHQKRVSIHCNRHVLLSEGRIC